MDIRKRLFFGIQVEVPWPDVLPPGRIIEEKDRHITCAFLNNVDSHKLTAFISSFPIPSFNVGLVGTFDQCLFFPKIHPRVVAWKAHMLEDEVSFFHFQSKLITWLKDCGFSPDCRHEFTPHVTIARAPFKMHTWEKCFSTLPFFLKSIQLYESLGNSIYHTLWYYPLLPPFEPIDHIADLAFWVRGENWQQIYLHAVIALAFTFPDILKFTSEKKILSSIEDVIYALNDLIFYVDKEMGCPFKAVSFHTKIEEKNQIHHWEMIVDV